MFPLFENDIFENVFFSNVSKLTFTTQVSHVKVNKRKGIVCSYSLRIRGYRTRASTKHKRIFFYLQKRKTGFLGRCRGYHQRKFDAQAFAPSPVKYILSA